MAYPACHYHSGLPYFHDWIWRPYEFWVVSRTDDGCQWLESRNFCPGDGHQGTDLGPGFYCRGNAGGSIRAGQSHCRWRGVLYAGNLRYDSGRKQHGIVSYGRRARRYRYCFYDSRFDPCGDGPCSTPGQALACFRLGHSCRFFGSGNFLARKSGAYIGIRLE